MPTTSVLYHAFGVRGYHHRRTYFEGGSLRFVVEPRGLRCPHCQRGEVVNHGHRWRTLRTVPIGRHAVFLEVKVPQVYCKRCNVLAEMHPSFADKYVSYTHQLARFVIDVCRISTIKGAAELAGVSWDVAKSIEKSHLAARYSYVPLAGVRFLAVDEIAVRRGHTYMTLVADLETGRVLYVAEGKGADALLPFLKRLKRSRARVKAIAMDMSAAYALAVRTALPKTPIVYDRFHVVKLMNEHLVRVRWGRV